MKVCCDGGKEQDKLSLGCGHDHCKGLQTVDKNGCAHQWIVVDGAIVWERIKVVKK